MSSLHTTSLGITVGTPRGCLLSAVSRDTHSPPSAHSPIPNLSSAGMEHTASVCTRAACAKASPLLGRAALGRPPYSWNHLPPLPLALLQSPSFSHPSIPQAALSSPELSLLQAAPPQLPTCSSWGGGFHPSLHFCGPPTVSPALRTPTLNAELQLRHLRAGTPPHPTPHHHAAPLGVGAAGLIQEQGEGTHHHPTHLGLLSSHPYLGEDNSSRMHHAAGRLDPHGAGGRRGQQAAPVDGQSAAGAACGHQQH